MQIINEANEKFKLMQQELCRPLFEMLREINVLEEEIGKREQIHYEQCLDGVNTEPDFFKKLWNEFQEQYRKIVLDKCTEKLLSKGCGTCINNPPKYHYIDKECVVIFTMKEPKKAVIEIHFTSGSVDFKHRFKFVKEQTEWLINAFDWYSTYDCVWHRGTI